MQPTADPSSPFPSSTEIVSTAILFATLPNLSVPHFLAPVIASATTHTRSRLIIVLFSRHFNVQYPRRPSVGGSGASLTVKNNCLAPSLTFAEIQSLSRTESWDAVQRILTFTYVQATKVAYDMGKVLMEVDVLLKGLNEDLNPDLGKDLDICFRVTGDSIPVPLPSTITALRQWYIRPGERHSESRLETYPGTPTIPDNPQPPAYPVTALGGTFDHLHSGHKILLSMAAYITCRKLIVGITGALRGFTSFVHSVLIHLITPCSTTDDALLQSKANKHILEPLPVRTHKVRQFLHFFKPEIEADIVPITDVYGPTGWDPDIQALVVSKETLGGAEAIAKHRQSKSLPPLRTFIIDVISSTAASLDHDDANFLKQHKLSSTFVRQWIVDQEKKKGKEGETEAA
ncbi:hypothetical protein CVT26_015997 [Gymnopilus dilepis]|uniref:Cytidyltransferase-like domain-containing protein n=1 Tax=Gymnopilus dilepis TaxID=231916 RepID=A0A409YDL3_9AGAR|nr:hypothetical protein CVT26_015997 [Gymnopilus dilepis]